MKGKLVLSIEPRPDAKGILKVEGSVDPGTIKEFEVAFKQLDKLNIRHIVVDVSQMTYISSAGLSVLVNAKVDRVQKAGDIVLVRPQAPVLNVLDILLKNVFRIASSIDEALLPPPARESGE
jgi:anti-sigma B factor antagonist